MIPYIRRQNIISELENAEVIYVEELAKNLNISVSTIRRDLKTLVDEGQIVSLRGGGVKLKTGSYEIPLQTKQLLNNEKKHKIAEYAASLVMPGDIIYVDSGTTTLYMIKYLKKKKITVVTSNTQAINEIIDSNITGIILGGEINKNLGSVSGPITEKLLLNMFFDKAFLGASGYSVLGGINTMDVKESTKKELVKNNSKITYVLVDSSKANVTNFCKSLNLSECTIITDEKNETLEKHANYVIV